MIQLTINPVPKPRMTQSDRWKRRDCTDRYWQYKDDLSGLLISNGKESAGISLNLERCQQLRKILDLYEQYLGRFDR